MADKRTGDGFGIQEAGPEESLEASIQGEPVFVRHDENGAPTLMQNLRQLAQILF